MIKDMNVGQMLAAINKFKSKLEIAKRQGNDQDIYYFNKKILLFRDEIGRRVKNEYGKRKHA